MKQWLIDLFTKIRMLIGRYEILPTHQNLHYGLELIDGVTAVSYCTVTDERRTAGVMFNLMGERYRADVLKLDETLESLSMAEVILPSSADSEMIFKIGQKFFGNISPSVVSCVFMKEKGVVSHLICDKMTNTIIAVSRLNVGD